MKVIYIEGGVRVYQRQRLQKLLEAASDSVDLPGDVICAPVPASLCESCPVGKAEDSFLVAGWD